MIGPSGFEIETALIEALAGDDYFTEFRDNGFFLNWIGREINVNYWLDIDNSHMVEPPKKTGWAIWLHTRWRYSYSGLCFEELLAVLPKVIWRRHE